MIINLLFKLLTPFFWLLSLLPLSWLHLLARPLGILFYYLARERRIIAAVNIKLCFPEKNTAWQQRIVRENFYHAAAMLLEYCWCWYASPRRIKKAVIFEHGERLATLSATPTRLLIFYPHFYGLELGALRLNLSYPLISVFTGQKNPVINARIYKGRRRFNRINPVRLIRRNEKIISIIHLLKKSPALFLYLPDQDFGRQNSIFVPFFNIPAATTTGTSRISAMTGRTVLPIIPIRQKHKIILKILPPLADIPSADPTEDTARLNLLLEDIIRRRPEQYLWLHKRFKTRPPGEKSVY